jgi:predicted acyltransferase
MDRDADRAARMYLRGAGLLFLIVFALPLLLHPYGWARRFGWRREPETDVGLYFGRCLGAVATALCVQCLRASREPSKHRSLFGVMELAGWLLSLVHLRGLLERRQPPIEHAEIVGYAASALAARRLRPSAQAGSGLQNRH